MFYAVSDDGRELPVIDLTHPSFSDLPDEAARAEAVRRFVAHLGRQQFLPVRLRRALLGLLGRRSVLIRDILRLSDGFLPGMSTYILKLGPDNLGRGYAGAIDRRIAASAPALSARIRLHNVARLLVEGLVPTLSTRPGLPLHMVNIAGGPAMDSLNALLLLRRDHPALLEGRPVRIHVLDLDRGGPAFGARALEAMRTGEAPLGGLDVTFTHHDYDWTTPARLAGIVAGWGPEPALIVASSEGGLFEYGGDDTVTANLAALGRLVPAGTMLAGSVTRDGPVLQALVAQDPHQQTARPRSLESFTRLVRGAGWDLHEVFENMMTFDVRIVRGDSPV